MQIRLWALKGKGKKDFIHLLILNIQYHVWLKKKLE
jgi:hypothetical protein